jgi:hypothetical protein
VTEDARFVNGLLGGAGWDKSMNSGLMSTIQSGRY